jgi:hypothetical protein
MMTRSKRDGLQKLDTLLETGYIMAQHIDKTTFLFKKWGRMDVCVPSV